jgi:hypothetical protein
MARVPKTSGQGSQRKSYQSGWRSGQRGTGAPGLGDIKPLRTSGPGVASGARGYGKGEGFQAPRNQPYRTEPDPDIVPFGVSNLDNLNSFLKAKPPKPKKGFT